MGHTIPRKGGEGMAFVVWTGVAVVAALLLFAAAMSKIRVRVRYAHSGAQDHLVVIVRALYGAYRYRLTVPSVMIRGKEILFDKKASAQITGRQKLSRLTRQTGNSVFQYGRQMLPWMRQVLRKVECTRFRLDFRVGTGDAVSTAIASGVLWSVYGCAVALAAESVSMKTKPHGAVEPVYGQAEFSAVWEADFSLRVGTFAASMLFGGIKATSVLKSWTQWRHGLTGPQHS